MSALRLIAHNLAQSVVQSNSGLVALKAVSPLQFSTPMARQCLETSTVQYIWLVEKNDKHQCNISEDGALV